MSRLVSVDAGCCMLSMFPFAEKTLQFLLQGLFVKYAYKGQGVTRSG